MKTQIGLFTALSAVLTLGCTEVTQTITPSPVDVNVTTPGPGPAEPNNPPTVPPGPSGTITLNPSSGQVSVGKNLNVTVVVTDANGQEVPSTNITVNIIDRTILSLNEIDARTISFSGDAVGVTPVIISASGLQTSMVITVVP